MYQDVRNLSVFPMPFRVLFERELVLGKSALVAQLNELLLDGFAYGHALVLAELPVLVGLFARGVDALRARRLLGVAQASADLAGGLLEGLQSHEEFRVDDEEEVSQAVHLRASVFRNAGQRLKEGASRQSGGKDLYYRGVSVALVARGLFSGAAERQQGGVARAHVLEDLAGVCHGLAGLAYAAEYGADVVIARPCHTFGPFFTPSDNRVYAQFIRNILRDEDIVMKSTGSQYRSWCYVVDCASALLHILLKGDCGQAYNIADPTAIITIRELAEMVAQIGHRQVVCQVAGEEERKGYNPVTRSVYSIDKLSALGWTIEGSMYEKMQRTIAAM